MAIYRTYFLGEGKSRDRVSKEIGRGAASGACTRTFLALYVRKKKEEVGPSTRWESQREAGTGERREAADEGTVRWALGLLFVFFF